MKKTLLYTSLALAYVGGPVQAQIAPDAGQTLQQLATPPQQPTPSQPLLIETPRGAVDVPPGGPKVRLKGVTFSGNSVFDAAELTAIISDALNQDFDLAGLWTQAERIAAFYRARGYPFVRVFVPAQAFVDGQLRIDILEGRYGRVLPAGDAFPADAPLPFLAALEPGSLIESQRLERTMLLLEDLPGVKIRPTIEPGREVGSGDLTVDVQRESYYDGEVGLDNAGNRYTGDLRARATLHVNSPWRFGDHLSINGLTTDAGMWLGSLDYELPLGGSGLRGQFGYAQTRYALGKEFSYLDATGSARIWTAKASYPLYRSQPSNLTVSLAYQQKFLEDRYGNTGSLESKSSQTLPLSLRFDHRDGMGGGGISYGALTWTVGKLYLDSGLASQDATTARKDGGFSKLNLDISRIQKLPGAFTLYGRYSSQWANKNLDSSERMGLGGVYGVRAYPMGEASGDTGWMTQVELRYAMGQVAPYVFYDAGQINTNAQPWDANSSASRFLSGHGLGVRVDYRGWNLDLSLAWRLQGGEATSDTRQQQPRVWLMGAYRF